MCEDIGCFDWCCVCACPHVRAAWIEGKYITGCWCLPFVYPLPCYGCHLRSYITTTYSTIGTGLEYTFCYATALIRDERLAKQSKDALERN